VEVVLLGHEKRRFAIDRVEHLVEEAEDQPHEELGGDSVDVAEAVGLYDTQPRGWRKHARRDRDGVKHAEQTVRVEGRARVEQIAQRRVLVV
jgi:hypothetical protein